jgi:thioredoxin reductase
VIVKQYEVAIVGGGPAGLSAALVLGRACRNVAVIDAGTPRNNASPGVHGFLSRDGILPADLKNISREQIAHYPGVTFIDQPVRHVRAKNNGLLPRRGFRITLNGGETLDAQSVILATGMIDELPDLPGFEQHWGQQVFHCPYCHGFENRGTRWGVLAKDVDDVEQARNYRSWTDKLTVFADRRLLISKLLLESLASRNIAVDRRPIRQLTSSDDGNLRAVEMQDGTQVPCEAIVYQPRQQHTGIVIDTGVALSANGRVWIDRHYETSIPGIFAAGDLAPGCQDALASAAEGAKAAKSTLGSLELDAAYPTLQAGWESERRASR